jgi:hypothetical protein
MSRDPVATGCALGPLDLLGEPGGEVDPPPMDADEGEPIDVSDVLDDLTGHTGEDAPDGRSSRSVCLRGSVMRYRQRVESGGRAPKT